MAPFPREAAIPHYIWNKLTPGSSLPFFSGHPIHPRPSGPSRPPAPGARTAKGAPGPSTAKPAHTCPVKTKITLALLVLTAALSAWLLVPPAVAGGRAAGTGFSTRSLMGSYASTGRAGGSLSRSIGVTRFDGNGQARREVTINTSDGGTGRRLLHLVSIGTYTINPDGRGTIFWRNVFDSGVTSEVTYDIVVTRSSLAGYFPMADEITGVQREPGQTAALVEESWTLRPGL